MINARPIYILSSLALIVVLAFIVLMPAVHASVDMDASSGLIAQAGGNYGLDATAGAANLPKTGTGADELSTRIGKILNTLLGFLGVIFLVITIYGGFLWMTAGGSSEQTKKAGTMIKNGAIGVMIILLSYGIVTFVFNVLLDNTSTATATECTGAAPSGGSYQCVISSSACTTPPNNGTLGAGRTCNYTSTPVCCIIP